jgi:two-component system OmpR family response regulator
MPTVKKAILIDNTPGRPSLTGLLMMAGLNVDEAIDSETGLGLLETRSYDIAVVTENQDQEIWRLCERIRNLTGIPLIIINANAGPDDCVRAINAGADYFLRKTFGPREFLARVNCLLQRTSPRQVVAVG